ncbi:MAG: cold shock domain-containing protein [Rubrobacter sp.]|nr:cold shock domain-containing protein [Rubrobacter sp.]
MAEIREWVQAGKNDDWIADALGTSASSVQSFRSRNDIYRRERVSLEPESVFEGVLDHGEKDGWGLWLDPSVAEDPIWKENWSDVDAVVVKVAEDIIVLEADRQSAGGAPPIFEAAPPKAPSPDGAPKAAPAPAAPAAAPSPAEAPSPDASDGGSGVREQGRVKWFDADKGYGFIIRPTGEDLFVHHSEVEGDASDLGPNGEVEYEVGRNDRGPNARSVRLIG